MSSIKYFVLYNDDESYNFFDRNLNNLDYSGSIHKLSKKTYESLDATLFALQLPRLYDEGNIVSFSSFFSTNACSPDVIVISITDFYIFKMFIKNSIGGIFVDDDISDEHWLYLKENYNCVYHFKDINQNLMNNLMKRMVKDYSSGKSIGQYIQYDNIRFIPIILNYRYLSKKLPLYKIKKDYYEMCKEQLFHINTSKYFYLGKYNKRDSKLLSIAHSMSIEEVILVAPGVPEQNEKVDYKKIYEEYDKKAVDIMACHKSISNNGCIINLPMITPKQFNFLDRVERGIRNAVKSNADHIFKELKELENKIFGSLSKEEIKIIYDAKHITVFSDFPIGIVIHKKIKTALHTIIPTSYNYLTPLDDSFRYEMMNHERHFINKSCKVLFLDCIDQNDRIWEECNNTYKDISSINECLKVVYKKANTIDEFNNAFDEDFDIIIVSAHGVIDETEKIAYIEVGNDKLTKIEPKKIISRVVMFSACNVSPRGKNYKNIVFPLLFKGAQAILTTLIPIDAFRNHYLLVQFFKQLVDDMINPKIKRNIYNVWVEAVAQCAIFDMMEYDYQCKEWLFDEIDSIRRIDLFLEKAKERINILNPYTSTKELLFELFPDISKNMFSRMLFENKYYPESIFYQWIGMPENIYIGIDSDIELMMDETEIIRSEETKELLLEIKKQIKSK